MFNLMQLYRTIDDKKLFLDLFNDLSFEIAELGFKNNESELVNDILESHFGITIDDNNQLERITKAILNCQKKLFILKELN